MTADEPNPTPPLLPIRTTLVLLLATLSAVAVTVLILLDGHSAAATALAGFSAFGSALELFHRLIA